MAKHKSFLFYLVLFVEILSFIYFFRKPPLKTEIIESKIPEFFPKERVTPQTNFYPFSTDNTTHNCTEYFIKKYYKSIPKELFSYNFRIHLYPEETTPPAPKTSYPLRNDQSLNSVTTSPDGNHLLYYISEKGSEIDSLIGKQTVVLEDVRTSEYREVNTYYARPGESNDEYFYRIRDLAFVTDDIIFITTSDAIMRYQISTNDFEVLHQDNGNESGVFSYYIEDFNADNNSLLIRQGYYEGVAWGVMNIFSYEYKVAPYFGYIAGEQVYGWHDNKLLVRDYHESIDQLINDRILLTDPNTFSEQTIWEYRPKDIDILGYKDHAIWYFHIVTEKPTNPKYQESCMDNYYILKQFDLNNMTHSEVS